MLTTAFVFALGLLLVLGNFFKPGEEEERKSFIIIYRYHGKAVFTFVPGLLFGFMSATANPAKKRRENCLFWPYFIYRYHSKTVLILVLGLLFDFASTTAPSEEEEREFFSLKLFIVITAKPC